ncbi:hypothetical protein GCM10022197_07830 [Microlunatus spumicola]|uniref:Right handed beta helix domain-containing protein n=1 Tax=Microlunatus spumicola TaxID=81499 RepID=A0ABP6WV17_9ACTN
MKVTSADGGQLSRSTLSANGTAVSLTPTVHTFTAERSRIRDNDRGFALSQSAMTLLDSQVTRNGIGIRLFQSGATVRSSTIAGNDTGIDGSADASNIDLSGSVVRANGVGVRLLGFGLRGAANAIESNTFKGNGGPGLVVDLEHSNAGAALRIAENTFVDNGAAPVEVGLPGVSDQGAAIRVAADDASVVVSDNQARGNAGIGIDVVGATDGGGNTARDNDGSSQCVGVVCGR